MRLIASAVVHNEADRYLLPWLRHLLTFCDEVRLLDDYSTDGTFEIAREHEGVEIKRSDGPAFFENESVARNALLAWTIEGQPTHVLAIDADEFVGDTVALRASLAMNPSPVYSLVMREAWKIRDHQLGLRVDGLWGDRRCPLLWAAPPRLSSSWRIPNKKLACGREPQRVRSQRGYVTGVGVYHFGWTRVAEREARAERYFEHDGGRYHANAHLQSILWPDEKVKFNWVAWPPSIPEEAARVALA